MLLPLYCHYSASDWKTLLSKKDLQGVTVILNPNDGPPAKSEASNWANLALQLASKGAEVVAYIDTCKATYVSKKWDLVPKSSKAILAEWAMYKGAWDKKALKGVFLDDFAYKRIAPNAEACDTSESRLCQQTKVIVNPGTVADKAWKLCFSTSTIWMEHEQDGFPKDTSEPFVALGVAKLPDCLKPGRYSYVHSAHDGKNPYESLSPFFDELLALERKR